MHTAMIKDSRKLLLGYDVCIHHLLLNGTTGTHTLHAPSHNSH